MAPRNGTSGRTSSRPLSVEQIVQQAKNFDYNPQVPLKYWLRSAGLLIKEAEIYESEGNQQQTYLLLFRHAQLVLNHLANHPDASLPDGKAGFVQAERDVLTGLEKLDRLKPQINKKYEHYEKLANERAVDGDRGGLRHTHSLSREEWRFSERGRRPSLDPSGSQSIAAEENKDLAVKLARTEIKRRAIARKATRQAGISEEVEQERRTAGLWGNWEEAYANDEKEVDRDAVSRQIQSVRVQVDGSRDRHDDGSDLSSQRSSRPRPPISRLQYSYPTIPVTQKDHNDSISESTAQPYPSDRSLSIDPPTRRPPTPPPKDAPAPSRPAPPPPKPAKTPLSSLDTRSSSPSPSISTTSPSSTSADLHPSTFTFKPSAHLENGSPLRTLFLPPDLRHRFLSIAAPNTAKNLETCGILCGTLISNALFISKLVIPEQTSTSDTCEMVNENRLFEYVDGEDLMVLGWIHTHPSQTCFMSSRDLHTHVGYQCMLVESVAIVCAPTKSPDWGVFRLTDPPGMGSVLNCTQSGLFHPHAEGNIYTDALRPGHVFEAKGLDFDVQDMRT